MYFGFLLLVFTNMVTDTYQDRVRFCDVLAQTKKRSSPFDHVAFKIAPRDG